MTTLSVNILLVSIPVGIRPIIAGGITGEGGQYG